MLLDILLSLGTRIDGTIIGASSFVTWWCFVWVVFGILLYPAYDELDRRCDNAFGWSPFGYLEAEMTSGFVLVIALFPVALEFLIKVWGG